MSREYFGSWGNSLNDKEFAGALAALGVLCCSGLYKQQQVRAIPNISSLLDNFLTEHNKDLYAPLFWAPSIRLHELNEENIAPKAKELSDAWDVLVQSGGGSVHIELVPLGDYLSILTWLYEQLGRHDLGVSGRYIQLQNYQVTSRMQMPLLLGCIDDDTNRLLNDLFEHSPGKNSINISKLSITSPKCDIFVSPFLLPTRYIKPPLVLNAACIIVFSDRAISTNEKFHLIDFYRRSIRTSGVCFVNLIADQLGGWLMRLTNLLIHNVPLDTAVQQASQEGQQGYLYASRDLIYNSPHYHFKKIMRETMQSRDITFGGKALRLRRMHAINRSSTLPRIGTICLGNRRTIVGGKNYFLDSSNIAIVKPLLIDESLRFIQAQFYEFTGREEEPLIGALIVKHKYSITIRIGPNDFQWLTPDEKAVFPEHLLPNENQVPLTVCFSEPYHAPDVQLASIKLPRQGASSECSFSFCVSQGLSVFEGRIIVAYKNRVLQTALIKADVFEYETVAGSSPTIEAEVVIRPNMFDLSDRTPFDLALVVNHSADNRPRLTKLSDDRAAISNIEDIQSSIIAIQGALEAATGDDARVNSALEMEDYFDSPETLELLNTLAIHGHYLYGSIIEDEIDKGWLKRHPERIQVVSAKADSYLPLEFIYEMPVPREDARLCPQAKQALVSGSCQTCLIPKGSYDSEYICPLGFWGLSKTIERHIHDQSYNKMLDGCDFALQAEPLQTRNQIQVLKTYLFAASERVNAVTPGLTDIFAQTLSESTSHGGAVVSTWENWVKEVADKKPTILMLMPHTLEDKKTHVPAMEIGESENLLSARITPCYVRASTEDPSPIVALLGCTTMVPYEKYMGFIPPLRRNGAALVLATLTTVLGRHVVPIAQKIIVELKTALEASDDPVSFGDILVHIRRKALLDGFPIVLSLVAYGDADWKLIQGASNVSH